MSFYEKFKVKKFSYYSKIGYVVYDLMFSIFFSIFIIKEYGFFFSLLGFELFYVIAAIEIIKNGYDDFQKNYTKNFE